MFCGLDVCDTVTGMLGTVSGRFLHWLNFAVSADIRKFEEEREYLLKMDPDERLVLLEREVDDAAEVIRRVGTKAHPSSVDRIKLKAACIQLRNKQQAFGAEMIAQVSLDRTKDLLIDQALTEKRFIVRSSLRKAMQPQVAIERLSELKRQDAFGKHLEDLVGETLQDHYTELKEEFCDLAETNEDQSEDEGDDIVHQVLEDRSRKLGCTPSPELEDLQLRQIASSSSC
ncbi:hypothetical protein [Crucian carp herpesvirus]|uniref:ORF91 n=1 Tax=Cyprinid herpesvirus 2 TaxID=317878 RepID=K7PCN6_CYHV2|nr:protein ORF91 [Cyprinid herpesvirus 2]APB92938.1 hypothetical protein [Crucian carp herpesvirus]AFJ20520.1 protein ORF91 [Cyprinid herpesvirus 2]AKC02037.1 hypothetical protein [Cyprinid herpesvirus 2]AMB21660.1 ORF91 [Cyprinid herpesvirus 2]QAU54813.1 protein ORF91 [Cyprinid herpesvirus 2]